MNYDLLVIKKKYGERFSKLCRSLFATLLETEGLLSKLILDNFYESHYLYDDIVENGIIDEFKNFIYSLVDVENNNQLVSVKTPTELMNEAGYDLYECKSDEDIQKFRKYYAKDEVLCTFNEYRLNRCYVFFAVKKDVDKIRREDFSMPDRQDKYGTSVISIQFTKDGSYTISIKNRYNHKVNNPDATFSNNLDNIIPGLAKSFEKYYGMIQKNGINTFEIPNYVRANDGRFYKYNYEINNIYYCSDNIIIDNFEVIKFDKSRYLIVDYFIIDFENKEIRVFDFSIFDYFANMFKNIKRISVENIGEGKVLDIINCDNKSLKLYLDKFNRIVKLYSDNIVNIKDWFLFYSDYVKEIDFPNLRIIGSFFMSHCSSLIHVGLDSVESIGDQFLNYNDYLKEINFPNLVDAGYGFLTCNIMLTDFVAPKLEVINGGSLKYNKTLENLVAPNLFYVNSDFVCNHPNRDVIYKQIKKNSKCFIRGR